MARKDATSVSRYWFCDFPGCPERNCNERSTEQTSVAMLLITVTGVKYHLVAFTYCSSVQSTDLRAQVAKQELNLCY